MQINMHDNVIFLNKLSTRNREMRLQNVLMQIRQVSFFEWFMKKFCSLLIFFFTAVGRRRLEQGEWEKNENEFSWYKMKCEKKKNRGSMSGSCSFVFLFFSCFSQHVSTRCDLNFIAGSS